MEKWRKILEVYEFIGINGLTLTASCGVSLSDGTESYGLE